MLGNPLPTNAEAASRGDHTRLTEYPRALAGLSRVASEQLPQDRLLHHACAVVLGVTHIKACEGAGMRLINHSAKVDLEGTIDLAFEPSGLQALLVVPLFPAF